mmetsp:Transcript_13461/g.19922  ORF Transcript_13461/g.19922 Transcript_13461/m.19922 type:complete len:123 (-) Transcript_13461:1982-2350(-)
MNTRSTAKLIAASFFSFFTYFSYHLLTQYETYESSVSSSSDHPMDLMMRNQVTSMDIIINTPKKTCNKALLWSTSIRTHDIRTYLVGVKQSQYRYPPLEEFCTFYPSPFVQYSINVISTPKN